MTDEFIGKIATDKKGEKLGKIIRIEQLAGKTIKKEVPYAIIHVIKIFRLDVKIPLELSKVIKSEGKKIYFDILQKDLNDEINKQKAIIRQTFATRKTPGRKEFYKIWGNK